MWCKTLQTRVLRRVLSARVVSPAVPTGIRCSAGGWGRRGWIFFAVLLSTARLCRLGRHRKVMTSRVGAARRLCFGDILAAYFSCGLRWEPLLGTFCGVTAFAGQAACNLGTSAKPRLCTPGNSSGQLQTLLLNMCVTFHSGLFPPLLRSGSRFTVSSTAQCGTGHGPLSSLASSPFCRFPLSPRPIPGIGKIGSCLGTNQSTAPEKKKTWKKIYIHGLL